MATRLALPREQVASDVGAPLPGAKLYFYAAGTSTPKNTYSDAALTTPNANPVIADSGGRFGDIFLAVGDYKVVLQNAAGVTVWTADPVAGAPGDDGDLSDGTVIATGTGTARSLAERFGEVVNARDFGAIGDGETDDTVAIQAALDRAEAIGATTVHLREQFYRCDVTGLRMPDGVVLEGRGVGQWDCVFHNVPKTWEGTTLLFSGTGTRDRSLYGITSGVDNGGHVTVGAITSKLTSFMNATSTNATRATPRSFSVAISPKTLNGGCNWGLRNLRLAPWIGTDGYSDYSDQATTSLGADWDVGVLLQDSEYVTLDNVQAVGYWRIAGTAVVTPGLDEYGRSERNRFRDCKLQGFVGLLIRATDLWEVQSTTATSLTVKHNAEQYWPTSGAFESTDAGTDFAYTGLTYSAGNLTFTGVTPDPTGKTQIRALKRGTGMAGTQIENCMIHGLDHVSGGKAQTLGFTDPSKGLEVSGFPIRGIQSYNSKVQTDEDVCAHFHECDDFQWFGGQFETGGLGAMIASPLEGSSTAAAPAGQTFDLRFYSTLMSGVDTTAFTPRLLHDDMRQINPRDESSSHFLLKALAGQDIRMLTATGQNFYVEKPDGASAMRVTATGNTLIENGGQLSLTGGIAIINADAAENLQIRNGATGRLQLFGASGNWGAGDDNTQTWGTSSFRWSTIYAGTGAINTSDAVEKRDIGTIDAALLDAFDACGPAAYRFKDAYATKGEAARYHLGYVAQTLAAAIQAQGLDPARYAIWCQDPLTEMAQVGEAEDGEPIMEERPALDENGVQRTRQGLRYDQFIALMEASHRRRFARLEARIAALEAP